MEDMKRKKTTDKKKPLQKVRTKKARAVKPVGSPAKRIVASDARAVGSMTDRDICNGVEMETLEFEFDTIDPDTRDSILPCMSDDELRMALKALLEPHQIQVLVAGGIVRHDIR